MYGLEGDFLSRGTPYGLVKGSTSRTVILTGHYDVVDTEEYGDFQSYAYDVEAWKLAQGKELETLMSMLPEEARADFETEEWLFGRGTIVPSLCSPICRCQRLCGLASISIIQKQIVTSW